MPTEPGAGPPARKKTPRAKPVNDGFVVYEVDGSVPNDPTQIKWPVVIPPPDKPQPPSARGPAPPEAEEAPDPK
jgi:hypothetical protein